MQTRPGPVRQAILSRKALLLAVAAAVLLGGCGPAPAPTAPAPTPAATTGPLVAGSTRTRDQDGMVMVYVPAGEFLMGSADSDGKAEDDEKPQHTVTLDAYWIDRTEVTNAQYRRCVEAGACRKPDCWNEPNANADEQPVVCVGRSAAQAYCQWAGAQLPSEAQWEKAARGSDGRAYPWGDDFDGSRLNFCDNRCEYGWKDASFDDGYTYAAPVGSYPAGASPYGALDMAGNVREWVADWYGPYTAAAQSNPAGPASGELGVLRGGTWDSVAGYVRAAYRHRSGVDGWSDSSGFRCAAPAGE